MSWNDLMRRLVMGKKRENGFSARDLPQNRRQVFKFIYKNRALELFNAGFLCILFCLPLIALHVYNSIVKLDIANTYKAGTLEFYERSLQILTIKNIINAPCMLLASVGLAGLFYVVRKLAWDEPISLFKDFGKGIKNSFLQFLIIGFVLAINIYVSDIAQNYLINYPEQNGVLSIALLVLLGVINLSLLIVYCYAFSLASLYSMNIIQVYKAAFMLTFKKLFTNILMVIVGILPLAIWFIIPNGIVYLIGVLVVVFGGAGYSALVITLFIFRQFDAYINKNEYPDMVNKGIYSEEDVIIEDELDEVTADEIEKLAEQIASEYDEESTQ